MNRFLGSAVAASLFATAALTTAATAQQGAGVTVPQPTFEPFTAGPSAASPTTAPSSTSNQFTAGGPGGLEACGTRGAGSTGSAAAGSQENPDFSRIDDVTCATGRLPEGQSAITAKVQTLLDRADVSPGVIDGWWGGMTEGALRAFERRQGLPVDGQMDPQIWEALAGVRDQPVTQQYTITQEDTQVVGPIPADYSEKAQYERLGFERATEGLAEKFHMDEDFLRALNPGVGFAAGETITVMAPGQPIADRDDGEAIVQRVRIDKSVNRLYALDGSGAEVASYPVTIGSQSTPSPTGTHDVLAVAYDPVYYYDPETFVQGDNHSKLELPPGPNNPVGLVWIDLSEDGYGIHGTPSPAKLYTLESHGCVRMTNWDALELADMVGEGTVVEFTQ